MKCTAKPVSLAALMLAILFPLYGQLSENFGTVYSQWPVPQWSQLLGRYGTTLVSGEQWYQDDWLNQSNPPNKCAKINIYGSTRNGWLITPPVSIPAAGYELKFNLGLLIWNGTTAPPDGAQPDDRFIVLMSNSPTMTNPTILRTWNNTGSQYVLDDISPSGSTVIIPLTGITGTKYFAFYAESTAANGDNDLMIDNVLIRPTPTDPSFHYTPTSIDFGQVMQNIAVSPIALTITNTDAGTLYLNPADFSILGTDAAMFSFNPANLPAALTVDQSVGIPVSFTPTSAGQKTAILQVVNSQTRSTYQIPLSGTALPFGQVAVGGGNTDLNTPIYPYFGYSYSQSIYLQPELNIANHRIMSISYYWNGGSAANASNNWNILMGHTASTAFGTSNGWIPCSSLAMVFSGEVLLPPTPGWITIPLATPFTYNNTDNLLIAVEDNETGYDTQYGYFYATPKPTNRSLVAYSDALNPDPASPPAGTLKAGIPNLMLQFAPVPSGSPNPVTLVNPACGAQGIDPDGFTLNWTPAPTGGVPTSYKVYLADSEAEILTQHFWITTNQCFNPVTEGQMIFTRNQIWYWTVEAINAEGSALTMPPYWFQMEPIISTFPYLTNFESCAANTLPPGWSRSSLSLGWKTGTNLGSTFFSIPTHSVYAAANDDAAGSGQNGSQDMLTMPQLDFSHNSGDPTLSFDSFFTGGYGQLAKVEVSGNGTNWNVISNLSPNSNWTNLALDLSAYAGQNPLFIRFHADDNGEWATGWAIDNVLISFSGLDTPTLSISAQAGGLQLSWNAVAGASGYRVEASPTPMQEDTWFDLITTSGLGYTYTGNISPLFFRVTALANR